MARIGMAKATEIMNAARAAKGLDAYDRQTVKKNLRAWKKIYDEAGGENRLDLHLESRNMLLVEEDDLYRMIEEGKLSGPRGMGRPSTKALA